MAEQIGFKVDGSFITDISRTWFWNENRPYEVCEELLLNCLVTDQLTLDERKEIARDILEGKSKLTGINTFTVEDDGENVRPIYKKIDEQTRKIKIQELKFFMDGNMIDFVDPYSVFKDIEKAKDLNVQTYLQCATYFWYEDWAIDKEYLRPYEPGDGMSFANENDNTDAGLWLYHHPDVAYDAIVKCNNGELYNLDFNDFWDAVYDIIKDDKKFSSSFFKKRNENYLAAKRLETVPDIKNLSYSEKREYNDARVKEVIEFTDKWLSEHEKPDHDDEAYKILQYDEMRHINHALKDDSRLTGNRDRMYLILPDDYEEWEGLIAPNGDFYSCDFGGHNAKAYHIICVYPSKFPNLDYENLSYMDMTNALDRLLEQGWCATRFLPSMGAYINVRTDGKPLTKAQENAIFDAKIKHDISVDLSPIGY